MDYESLLFKDNLPNRLKKEELYKYFEQFKNGDNKARELIIIHNIKLVLNIVEKRYADIPCEKEELIQVGIEGLIKAVDTVDIPKDVWFSTYANNHIRREIDKYIAKWEKYTLFESEMGVHTKNENFSISAIDRSIDAINYIEKLNSKYKEVFLLYFGFHEGHRYAQCEIGNMLGISHSYVNSILKKGLEELKDYIIFDEKQSKEQEKEKNKIKKKKRRKKTAETKN